MVPEPKAQSAAAADVDVAVAAAGQDYSTEQLTLETPVDVASG